MLTIIFIILYKKKKELFTNESGQYCDSKNCSSLTLSDCLKCSDCGYCMTNNYTSKCVAGKPRELLASGKCDRVYSNDMWTRAALAGDNDYHNTLDLPIMD